jgi:hypothetical protein
MLFWQGLVPTDILQVDSGRLLFFNLREFLQLIVLDWYFIRNRLLLVLGSIDLRSNTVRVKGFG